MTTEFRREFFLAEYGALRDEILKRIEIVHQLKGGLLLAWSAILGFAIQSQSETKITQLLLLYPVLALAIAWLWAFNNRAIILLGNYIRAMEEEAKVMGATMGWEHHVRGKSSGAYSAIGIFVCTQALTLLAAKYMGKIDLPDWRLLAGIGVCVWTGFVIWRSEIGVPHPRRIQVNDITQKGN